MKRVIFRDRSEAGKILAGGLLKYSKNSKVLAIPRGGVPVAKEIASMLDKDLSVIMVRKIGAPGNPEFGVGAIAERNTVIYNSSILKSLGIKQKDMKDIKKKESAELARRVKLYRKGKKPPLLTGKTAILVDDGLATGITAKAAAIAAKRLGAKRIIFAAPVCSFQGKRQIEGVVDEIIYISEPEDMKAVGLYYKHFEQVSDKKVIEILTK